MPRCVGGTRTTACPPTTSGILKLSQDGACQFEEWKSTGARGLGTPSPRALARARVAPRVRSCESVSECCGWCRRAGAHGTGHSSWSAHSLGTSPPFTSRVRRAAGAAKGPRAPRGYSRIVVRPASASAHPTLHRWRWLLILNMVPGARGLALASMVPRVSKTYIAYFHQQPRGHPPFIDPPPSTTPLDHPPPETCACFFHVCRAWCAILLLLVHRAATLVFVVPAVSTKVGGFGHAWWRSKTSRKKLLLLPRPNPSPVLPLTRDQLSTI